MLYWFSVQKEELYTLNYSVFFSLDVKKVSEYIAKNPNKVSRSYTNKLLFSSVVCQICL